MGPDPNCPWMAPPDPPNLFTNARTSRPVTREMDMSDFEKSENKNTSMTYFCELTKTTTVANRS